MVVDIDRDRAQSEWYHVRTIRERSTDEEFAKAYRAVMHQE